MLSIFPSSAQRFLRIKLGCWTWSGSTLLIHFTLSQSSPPSLTARPIRQIGPYCHFPPFRLLGSSFPRRPFTCSCVAGFAEKALDPLLGIWVSKSDDFFFFLFQQLDALLWASDLTSGLTLIICKMRKKEIDITQLPFSCKSVSKFRQD